MRRHPFAIGIFILECFCVGIIFIASLMDMKLIISLVCGLVLIGFYFCCFISDIYGIKIKDKYIVFHTEGARQKISIEDIKNIDLWFIKKKKHYKVKMRVHFKSTYNKKEFSWDEIMIKRIGIVKTKIDSNNIHEYISLFNSIDKFYVYPIK